MVATGWLWGTAEIQGLLDILGRWENAGTTGYNTQEEIFCQIDDDLHAQGPKNHWVMQWAEKLQVQTLRVHSVSSWRYDDVRMLGSKTVRIMWAGQWGRGTIAFGTRYKKMQCFILQSQFGFDNEKLLLMRSSNKWLEIWPYGREEWTY